MIEWLLTHAVDVLRHLPEEDKGVVYVLPLLEFLLRPLLDLTTRCEGDSVSLCEPFPLLVQVFLYYDDIREDVPAFKRGIWAEAWLELTSQLWVYTLGFRFFFCLSAFFLCFLSKFL
jgi:hypothetical protein